MLGCKNTATSLWFKLIYTPYTVIPEHHLITKGVYMSKFNTKTPSTKTVNKAGGFALKMSPEMELVHAVLVTFLEDTYYEKSADRKDRIKHLISINKPQFVANLAVIARREFHLRSVTTLLLGELAKNVKGEENFVKDVIVAATERVDDLTELASYTGVPIPKQVKRGIRNALYKFNRYQLAKYKGTGKEISLVDLFNLVHPKPKHATEEQQQAWKDLIEGNLKSFDTWEVDMAAAKDDVDRKKALQSLISENKMGYMALLRNLNNIVKYGVSEDIQNMVIAKLTDPEEVAKSKQLPFRYFTAYKNVEGNTKFLNAIATAMDLAVSNTPTLPGKTLIALDCSGSMGGDPMEKGSVFAATLMKSNPDADVILYDTGVKKINLTTLSPVVAIANDLVKMAMGGGTDTSLVFQYALQNGGKYDRFIIISDNESWADSRWRGGGTQETYNEYKKQTSTNPEVFAIDIMGNGTKDIDSPKVHHLTGWSDRLLDFVGKVEQGESLVSYVKSYKI